MGDGNPQTAIAMAIDVAEIAALGANKTAIALPWPEMQRLETFLGRRFGIEVPPDGYDLMAAIRGACGDGVADEYEGLREARRREFDTTERLRVNQAFYELISADPLLGLVNSTRWPYILDSAAYLTALLRALGTDGSFIDIGCHAGYHALWLTSRFGMAGRGVDTSPSAVRYARNRMAELGILPPQLVFDSRPVRERTPTGGYSLVYSADGPITLGERSFSEVAGILADDGVFVWMGNVTGLDAKNLREALAATGLSLLFGDVIGGWDGKVFLAKGVLVMAKGQDADVSDALPTEITSVWPGFARYCNADPRPASEKTLSKYRSWVTYGSPTSEV